MKRQYFKNPVVEWTAVQYQWSACTDVRLRDQLLDHSRELSRQVIRKLRLARDEAALDDLSTVAWIQIERTLYKFRAEPHCRPCYEHCPPYSRPLVRLGDYEYRVPALDEVLAAYDACPRCGAPLAGEAPVEPTGERYGGTEAVLWKGCSKLFNMWSQVARQSCFAALKKEGRHAVQAPKVAGVVAGRAERAGRAREAVEALDALEEFFRYDGRALALLADFREAASSGLPSGPPYVSAPGSSRRTGVPVAEARRYLRLFRLLGPALV